MISKIWFINLMLAAGVVFFGIKTYQVWFEPEKPMINPKSAQNASTRPEIRLLPKTVPPQTSYQIVAEKTIFSPDRKEQTKTAEKAQNKAPSKFNLCGVMMSDGYKSALISDPAKTGTAKNRLIKEGDMLDDMKVSAIQNDRIVLSSADSHQEVLLYDSAKVIRREQVQKEAEPVIIAGADSQSKALTTKEDKQPVNPLAAAITAQLEKKPEASQPDKKPADVPAEKKSQSPDPAKTPAKAVSDPMNNPLLNLFQGMK